MKQRTSPQQAPGWYSDPQMFNTLRFWDGQRWTDQSQPGSARDIGRLVSDVREIRNWVLFWSVVGVIGLFFFVVGLLSSN